MIDLGPFSQELRARQAGRDVENCLANFGVFKLLLLVLLIALMADSANSFWAWRFCGAFASPDLPSASVQTHARRFIVAGVAPKWQTEFCMLQIDTTFGYYSHT